VTNALAHLQKNEGKTFQIYESKKKKVFITLSEEKTFVLHPEFRHRHGLVHPQHL
jgi:hypothetical protein